jgi:competence protein ComEA
MIDDPPLPSPRRRLLGRSDPPRLSPTPLPDAADASEAPIPPAAPPPLDEWDVGGTEAGWDAVAPPPFGAEVEHGDPDEAGPVGAVPAHTDAVAGRDLRPLLVRVLRPWFEPRPGELRSAIVLLLVGLGLSLAFWFDASRRPEGLGVAPSDPLAPVAQAGIPGAAPPAGRADGSDGWGLNAEDVRGPVVHVSGAVQRPGVVTLREGDRVADAIEAAGGSMPDARLDGLNLARIVDDAERVHVPRVGEDAPPPAAELSRGILPDGRIDLNAASAAELETLPGVGPARAQAIITERDARAFRVPGDLRRVPGIGEATFQRLAPLVAIR